MIIIDNEVDKDFDWNETVQEDFVKAMEKVNKLRSIEEQKDEN
jgi:hypothetical protein